MRSLPPWEKKEAIFQNKTKHPKNRPSSCGAGICQPHSRETYRVFLSLVPYSLPTSFFVKAKLEQSTGTGKKEASWISTHKCLRRHSCDELLSWSGLAGKERDTPSLVIFESRICTHFFISLFSKSLTNFLFGYRAHFSTVRAQSPGGLKHQRTPRFPKHWDWYFHFLGWWENSREHELSI